MSTLATLKTSPQSSTTLQHQQSNKTCPNFFSKVSSTTNNNINSCSNYVLTANNYSNKCNSGCHFDKDATTISNNNKPSNQTSSTTTRCAGCRKVIKEKYLLKALDQLWHEDCLKCSCCDCRLGEVGSTLFTKANLLLCRRDYLRLFGTTGYCSACSKMIPAFEMVMRAKSNVYHLECFACQQCSHRFCVGDRYFLCDNKILCEYDYEERLLLAKASFEYAAYSQNLTHSNSLFYNAVSNNNNPNSQYQTTEPHFSFQSPGFFPTPPPFGNRSSIQNYGGSSYTVLSGGYQQNPASQLAGNTSAPSNTTRIAASDDISSGYGSPSPTST